MLLSPFVNTTKNDEEKIKTDCLASEQIKNPSKETDTLCKQYHITLSTLIDKQAPLHTKHTKAKYIPGWVTETIIAVKETEHCFNIFGKERNQPSNRSHYMQKVQLYNRICMQAKSQFLKAKIQDNYHNPQKLWHVLGDVLHRLTAKMLSSIKPPQLLAGRSVKFFTEKMKKYAQHSLLPSTRNTSSQTLLVLCFPFSLLYVYNRGLSYQNYDQLSK